VRHGENEFSEIAGTPQSIRKYLIIMPTFLKPPVFSISVPFDLKDIESC
jgi:hypothetical protein